MKERHIITLFDTKGGVSISFQITATNLLQWQDDKQCPYVNPKNEAEVTFKNFGETVGAFRINYITYDSPIFGRVWEKQYFVTKIPTHPPIPVLNVGRFHPI